VPNVSYDRPDFQARGDPVDEINSGDGPPRPRARSRVVLGVNAQAAGSRTDFNHDSVEARSSI